MKPLADKPSEMLRDAVGDLEKCEADPKYSIDMAVWYVWKTPHKCFVCLGGAVIAQRLNPTEHGELTSDDFDEATTRKLQALDLFREGDTHNGLCELGLIEDSPNPTIPVNLLNPPIYRHDPEAFKVAMLAQADRLQGCGF